MPFFGIAQVGWKRSNKSKMGRYANFSADGVSYEYKFWFGIQDSEIPWASEKTSYRVEEYDEDRANQMIQDGELTEEQKQIWEEYEDAEIEEHDITEETQFLYDKMLVFPEYSASDTDAELSKYWNRLEQQARRMGLKRYSRKEDEGIMEAYERYCEEVIEVAYKEKESKKSESEKEEKAKQKYIKRLADINIKTLICCILLKHGSYSCWYEC